GVQSCALPIYGRRHRRRRWSDRPRDRRSGRHYHRGVAAGAWRGRRVGRNRRAVTLRASTTTLAAALVLSALAAPAAADDRAVIEGQAAAGTSGRIAVNQAAGTGNAQANLASIAIADGGTGLVGLQRSE